MAAYNLDRFKKAQAADYSLALEEIREGQKRSHWIWYIFPQLKGLGFSGMSDYYGIKDLDEAKAYLADKTLKTHLLEISRELLKHKGKSASGIFGYPDDLKVRSCMTLFSHADQEESVFQEVLDSFFNGIKDERTLRMLKQAPQKNTSL